MEKRGIAIGAGDSDDDEFGKIIPQPPSEPKTCTVEIAPN